MQSDTAFLRGRDLAVYRAPWCGDCRRLERFLESTDIRYRRVDIEAEPAKRAIPIVLVEGRA